MAFDSYVPLEPDEAFRDRLNAYATKSVCGSRRRSAWTAPDANYKRALYAWIDDLMTSTPFKKCLQARSPTIAEAGNQISLSRLVLKTTMPGVPDIYQGYEFEDLSLVDPDNRRAVDYKGRALALQAGSSTFGTLKLHITATLLKDRAASPELYAAPD